MKEMFDYINNNSFLTSIIGVIVGWFLTTLTTIFINNKNNKERRREEFSKEKRRQYENKAELKIISTSIDCDKKPDIEVFLAPFKVIYDNEQRTYDIEYPENILDRKKHKYKEFCIQNIGKCDINQLDICATFKNHNVLVDYDWLEDLVNEKYVDYNYFYDRKILKKEIIIVRVYFLEEYQIYHPFSSTLAILFKDSYGNLWEQAFWYEKNNLYEARNVSYAEYHNYITADDAIKSFENPWQL